MVFKRFKSSTCEELDWHTNEIEIQMMYAMLHHKPVGINKHFHMACIIHTLQKNLNRRVSSQSVWKYLESLYNLPLLGETEDAQFPIAEKDFCLPESCMFVKKEKLDENVVQWKGEESSDKSKNIKPKELKVKLEDAREASRSESGSKVGRKSLVKGNIKKEQIKEEKKEVKKEGKEKKSNVGHDKPVKQDSKENKEDKKDVKKDVCTKKETEEKETKGKLKDSAKEKQAKKDDSPQTSKKEKLRDDSPKRNAKRTRGSMKDDASSSHSSSPVTTQGPSSQKRRRI